MDTMTRLTVRNAKLPDDAETVRRLWLDYLIWGNHEMQARHGVHPHELGETVEQDLKAVAKFQAPEGQLVLGFRERQACGIGGLHRIGEGLGEIKRIYLDPSFRRAEAGRAILDSLSRAAGEAGYAKVRLDSPDFMTAAHALYRSRGFRALKRIPKVRFPQNFGSTFSSWNSICRVKAQAESPEFLWSRQPQWLRFSLVRENSLLSAGGLRSRERRPCYSHDKKTSHF